MVDVRKILIWHQLHIVSKLLFLHVLWLLYLSICLFATGLGGYQLLTNQQLFISWEDRA